MTTTIRIQIVGSNKDKTSALALNIETLLCQLGRRDVVYLSDDDHVRQDMLEANVVDILGDSKIVIEEVTTLE